MTIGLAPKQLGSFEELLMSQVVQQEALIRLLVEKGGAVIGRKGVAFLK